MPCLDFGGSNPSRGTNITEGYMATKIDAQYLKTNFGYDIKNELRSEVASSSNALIALFNQVYDEMFLLASSDDITVRCIADMETRLDTPEKQDWFRKAQCYQLMYEMRNGKNSMFTPDNFDINAKSWDWCSDTLRIMRQVLGFNHPTMFTKRI